MIYCPHCKKPSARTTGACPHCGGELSKDPRVVAPSEKSGQEDKFLGAPGEFVLEDSVGREGAPSVELVGTEDEDVVPESDGLIDKGSGLELETSSPESDSSHSTAKAGFNQAQVRSHSGVMQESSGLELSSLAPQRTDTTFEPDPRRSSGEITVRERAQFGTPETGLVGAIKYWIHVRNRLKSLVVEHREALEKAQLAETEKKELLSTLGRRGFETGVTSETLEPLLSKARIAEGDLKGTERQRTSLTMDYENQLRPLEISVKKIEVEIEPARKQESELLKEKKNFDAQKKGIETKMRRVEIDLRNMDSLINQRQAIVSDLNKSQEERDKAFADIAKFENRKPGLISQIEGFKKEIGDVMVPISGVETKLEELGQYLDPKREQLRAIDREKERLALEFAKRDSDVSKQIAEGADKAEVAWAAVGERIILEKCEEPRLKELQKNVKTAVDAAFEAAREAELLASCLEGYDHQVVRYAQKSAIIAGVGLLVLLVLIAIFT